jgi:hypothetical protein
MSEFRFRNLKTGDGGGRADGGVVRRPRPREGVY